MVIGLAFVFLFASLICTVVKEGLESLINERSELLTRTLGELLADPVDSRSIWCRLFSISGIRRGACTPEVGNNKAEIKEKPLANSSQKAVSLAEFYQHPLINSLYFGDFKQATHRELPSYVAPKSFASALMDIVLGDALAKTFEKIRTEAESLARTKNPTPDANVIAEAGEKAVKVWGANLQNIAAIHRQQIDILPNEALRKCLLTLLADSLHDPGLVKAKLEWWYNEAMNRVSGYYKVHSQRLILVISVVITFSLNINSVVMAQKFIRQEALSRLVVPVAEQIVKGSNVSPRTISPEQMAILPSLPIGWSHEFIASWNWLDPLDWLTLVAGWVGTIFAISLGAPFWFDLLNRIVRLRSAIKPEPEKKGGD